MSTVPQTSVLGRISSLIEEINGVKTASAKQATELGLSGSAKSDPGGYQGGSDHPSARAATNLQKTPLGSRAKENEADVKKDHPGAGVDNTSAGSGGDQDSKQINIGTHQSATGEDPKSEDDFKGDKDDKREGERGGTSHPANAEDVGEKYSSMKFAELSKVAYERMNDVLADIANGVPLDKPATPAPASATKASAAPAATSEQEKVAAAQAVIEQTILDARINADLVGEFLTKFSQHYETALQTPPVKRADDVGPMGGAMEGEMGGAPPGAGGPPAPPPPGGDPAGGDPAGGGAGPEGGLDEFINALLAMGLTPEQIEAALQQHMGGGAGAPPPGAEGAGGPPPGAGAPPPGAEGAGGPPMPPDMGKVGSADPLAEDRQTMRKVAAMAGQRFRSGHWKPVVVQPGTKEAHERTELQRYILEVCGVK